MDVKTLCLGVLERGNATGYEIKRQCEEGPYADVCPAGFGSIYPALTALAADGLVTCTAVPQDGRPDKKVYHLTSRGRLELLHAVGRPPARDRQRSDTLFAFTFGHLIPAHRLDRMVDDRIAELHGRIAELERRADNDGAAGEAFVRGYGIAACRAQIEYLKANRHLLLRAALDAPRPEPVG